MSLKAYKAFLAKPSSGALAENASLHYTSTLTSIEDATAIIKHLAVQTKLLKKTDEKIISAVVGANALSLDVETSIEFVNGGGAYLPGLDDNFLSDRKVTFPMVHIVHFDQDGKISQIRLYWDQGSLLKQVEVIGARSRNWPIRDGKEIIRLIATSTAAVDQPESVTSSRRSTTSRGADEVSISERAAMNRKAGTNAMNDPHATLSLFAPRDVNEDGSPVSQPIAPRAQSARPPPREYSELFVGEETNPDSPSPSPQKIPVKSGGGKNYKPSRLFDEEEETTAPTPLSIKTNSKKYNHFEFGDEENTPTARESAPTIKTKHQSQWDFDDFVTPNKVKPKVLGQAVRHFGWSDDEEEGSPIRRPIVHKARPDADPHFEFVDDGTPDGEKKAAFISKGRLHNKGLGLYKDHVLGEEDEEDTPKGDTKRALNDVTTAIKNENRAKDFGSQWEMADDSPGPNETSFNGKSKAVPESRKTVVKGMEAHWGLYEDSPENRGIKAAGNGMGARKGTEAHWSLFDESPEKKENTSGKSRGIRTTGDGMGGRKNADSFWDF